MSHVGRIFVFQPGYGAGVAASHRQFWMMGTKMGSPFHGKLNLAQHGISLLANCFNAAWVEALNRQADGEDITHFAMLHDDIAPDDFWVDTLMEDLLHYEADLMAAVVPIKDATGLTSTAIEDPNDLFSVERRLTVAEIKDLPPVFTAADCGYPGRKLLVNTGCWVCDFTKPWRLATNDDGSLKLRFTIKDTIRRNQFGRWSAEVAPEDWNFSRDLHDLGAKVMASKRLGVNHFGMIPFRNDQDWGQWKYDQMFGHKFGNQPINTKG